MIHFLPFENLEQKQMLEANGEYEKNIDVDMRIVVKCEWKKEGVVDVERKHKNMIAFMS